MAAIVLKVLSTTLEDIALVLPTTYRNTVGFVAKFAHRTYSVMEANELTKTNQQLVVQLAERSLIVARMVQLYLAQSRPQNEVFIKFVSNLHATIQDVLEFVQNVVQQGWLDRLLNGNEVKLEFENLWRRLDALAGDYQVYLLQNMASRGPSERIEHPQLREFWSFSLKNAAEAKWVHFWDAFQHSFPSARRFLIGPSAFNNRALLQAKAQPKNFKKVGPWEINNIFQPPDSTIEQILYSALAYSENSPGQTVVVTTSTGTLNKDISTKTVTGWTGYWKKGSYKGVMTAELLVHANHRIYGGGSDEIGEFTCTGEWGAGWGGTDVHFIKHYLGRYQVEYDGAISNTIINGSWTKDRGLFDVKGEFLLQQKTELSCTMLANAREAEILKLGEVQRWSGFYKHCQGESSCEMSVEILFTCTHKIYGGGRDPVGQFTLLGRYHQTSHSILVTINKQYLNGQPRGRHILYMGAVSHSLSVGESEDLKVVMEGSWVINTKGFSHNADHGKFSLQPEVDN